MSADTITVHVSSSRTCASWAASAPRTFLGCWYSAPAAPWQNCQMAWEMREAWIGALREDLNTLRIKYRQDSIALTTGQTELIRGGEDGDKAADESCGFACAEASTA